MHRPLLTLAICTYNRAAKLDRTLSVLSLQTWIDCVDAVVVDDGSADATHAVVSRHPWVRLVTHPENRGLAAARNTALAESSTTWVVFTDDDCLPHPTWLEQIDQLVRAHPNATAVGGRVIAERTSGLINAYLQARTPFAPLELSLMESRGFWHRLREYLRRSATSEASHGERLVASLSGANMAVRRDVVLELGGWDTRFVIGGEEEELFRRALESGGHIVYSPAPLVEHNFDNTWSDLLGRSHRYGRGNARMNAKHGGLPTLYPAPVLVLACVALAPAAPVMTLGAVLLPQIVFSTWVRSAWSQRRPSHLLFPYLQVAQEAASNVGWWHAWRHERPVGVWGDAP
jgi:GT2 family glycosyltransferase